MTIRFLHAADIHLGYRQYDESVRYEDFARAFMRLVDDAVARRVDFVLIAGDLFHQRTIEPRTLFQAARLLGRLKAAGIPAIAIEGNHEKPYSGDDFSWLDYLAEAGLIMLLNPAVKEGRLILDPCKDNIGAYLDLPGGVRVIGMKYYGGSTPRMVRELTRALADMPPPQPAFTILMLHAGLEGILDQYAATLTRAELEPLRPYADYLALGHIHKPFTQDDWIYNPGSLETNSVEEVAWEDRGYFLVEVDASRRPAHRVTPIRGVRRAFERFSFAVDRYETPESLYAALDTYMRGQATPDRVARRPVVELQLVGALAFDAADLDRSRVEELVKNAFEPVIRPLIRILTAPSEFEIRPDEAQTREQMEHQVLCELFERDMRYRNDSEAWANLTLRLKKLALGDSNPDGIIAELRAFAPSLVEDRPC